MNDIKNNIINREFTITNGNSESTAINIQGFAVVKLWIPNNFNATMINFLVSIDNVNFHEYYNVNNEAVKITTVANQSRTIGIVPMDFLGFNYIKLKSNIVATNDTIITLTLQDLT